MEKFIQEPRYIPVDFDPFGPNEILQTIPTTEAQQEVMLAAGMSKEASCAYIESVSLELKGTLEHAAILKAVDQLVQRHGSLRSTLSATGTRMMIWAHQPVTIPVVDLSGHSPEARSKALAALSEKDMTTEFDLINGPLFRAQLIRLGANEHHLRLTAHHAVCDGWSLGIMMAEISSLYTANLTGEAAKLPEPVAFSDYALATFDFARSAEHATVEEYWGDVFKGPVAQLDLPTDHTRPRQKTYAGNRLDLDMEPQLVSDLRAMATRNGASFVTTLLTSFELLIHKLTGEQDMVVGLPAAGQSDFGMKHLVGHCVNLLALRSWIDEERPFVDHLKQRRTAVLDAFDNQKYTFGTLLKKLNLPRIPGRVPLVPVVFNIDMNMDDGVAFQGLQHRFISNARRYENFELFLNATGSDDRLTLEWSYNADLFDEQTVREWMDEFTALIRRIISRPEARIGDLVSATDLSVAGIAPPLEWSGAAVSYPRNKSISQLFDEVSQQNGDRVALVQGSTQVTYAQLRNKVNNATAALIDAGVRPGDLVGLCAERNVTLMVAHLAILRAGACYVPIDQTYPEDRIRFIIEDTKFKVLVTDPSSANVLPAHQARTVALDPPLLDKANAPSIAPLDKPENPAYIMYTSGSTGKPKGVVVPQRSIVRLVRNQNYVQLGTETVMPQLSNVSFDASTYEIYGALLNGGKLVLLQQAKPSMRDITDAIERNGVNTMFITTGLFNLLVDEQLDRLKGLKSILTGGEAMSVPHITKAFRALGPGVLSNIYGPTENTTYSCAHRIDSEGDIGRAVPIGKAINNTFLYVLDEQLKPVGVGVKGELYTGGDGVALGYWQRPDLTAERFLPDPFLGGEARMYRTGDLVRWNTNGSIEFLGRADDQVKVRGFRIELGEIENAISDIPGVRDRVVMARKDMPGDHQLVSYIVPADFDPENDKKRNDALIATVRKSLEDRLPAYMLPSFHVVLRELPLNANGKVDKKRLPMPDLRAVQMTVEHVAPRNATEKKLAAIWTKVLGVEDIGIYESFFDLGGHSILGIQMLTQIEQQFGRTYGLNLLFRSPTIAELAVELSGEQVENVAAELKNVTPIKREGNRVPLFCVHGDEANHLLPRYLSNDQPFYGTVHQGEDGMPMRFTSVEAIATHYIEELQRLVPQGPYNICGYSFGGLVAFEVARQLRQQGHEVPLVIMLDSYAPEPFAHVMQEERKFYEPVKKTVMRALINSIHGAGKVLPMKLRNFNIIDTYDRATPEYKAAPYDGDVAVIKAVGSPGPPDMGWRKHVRGNLILRNIEGDHYNIIKEPLVADLAKVMEGIIVRKETAALGVV